MAGWDSSQNEHQRALGVPASGSVEVVVRLALGLGAVAT